MTYKENITAILECYFTGFKKEIIDSACNRILEQEPCEDAISREAVRNIVDDIRDCVSVEGYWAILERLKKLPSVNQQETVTEFADRCRECGAKYGKLLKQQPKTGHWIYDRTRDWNGECKYECSECGMGSDVDYAYCMRCGAKMIEPQERSE